jgi:multiple sugar transport system substrate-binding protein
MDTLISENKVMGGQVLLDEAKLLAPLFPGGAPPWYSQFGIEAANIINAVAQGDMTVEQGVNDLAAKVETMK